VDRILDAAEIVVKRPGRYLKGIPGFAGATILGDGKVVQILDVLYLAEKAGVRGREKKHRSVPAPAPSHGQATTRGRFLLVERSSGARLAFPLSVVYRLEEFPRSRFERATEADVIQYRGRILPVWHLEDLLRKRRGAAPPNGEEAPAVDPVPVVVLRHGGRLLGIAMPRIVDVVAARTSPRQGHQQGSSSPLLVLGGRVVEVLDVEAMLGAAGAVAEKQAVVSGVSDDA
jgi:two-component system chemotaxis sensor kinase CheA